MCLQYGRISNTCSTRSIAMAVTSEPEAMPSFILSARHKFYEESGVNVNARHQETQGIETKHSPYHQFTISIF